MLRPEDHRVLRQAWRDAEDKATTLERAVAVGDKLFDPNGAFALHFEHSPKQPTGGTTEWSCPGLPFQVTQKIIKVLEEYVEEEVAKHVARPEPPKGPVFQWDGELCLREEGTNVVVAEYWPPMRDRWHGVLVTHGRNFYAYEEDGLCRLLEAELLAEGWLPAGAGKVRRDES